LAAAEHLIIVLPGIGGSVLAHPGDPDRVVWSDRYTDIGRSLLVQPQRLSVGEHEHLDPVGVLATRTMFGMWTTVPGYHRLLQRLEVLSGTVADDGSPARYQPDAHVVAVPYDFRRSIREAAQRLDDQVSARLARLWPRDADPAREGVRARVVVVAHSMGGLVARYWLAQHENWRLCRALITLATPHRGAPKALDVLANGIPLKNWRITRPVPVLREWTGATELLPRYPAVVDDSPDGAGQLRYPHELDIPWLQSGAQEAWAVHRAIEDGWSTIPRSGTEVVARIGYGHDTLRHSRFDGHTLAVTTDPPAVDSASEGLGLWATDLGDGTVPAYSGLPVEMDGHTPWGLRVMQRHGPIADLDEVIDLVGSYDGRPPHSPIRGEQRPVVLGLGVEEVALAADTIEVTARIAGTDTNASADVGMVAVWATLTSPDHIQQRAETRLDWDTDRTVFVGELPTGGPGLAQVEVLAEAVPVGGDLETSAWVEVLDDEDLD
jgi:hypothetical protein